MAQQLDSPKTEIELRQLTDKLFSTSQQCIKNHERPSFKGLLEIASSEVVILTAIHNITANKGSQTSLRLKKSKRAIKLMSHIFASQGKKK